MPGRLQLRLRMGAQRRIGIVGRGPAIDRRDGWCGTREEKPVRRRDPGGSLDVMRLSWLDPDQPVVADVAGAVTVLEAARVVDCPHQLGPTAATLVADLRHGWDGDPRATAVARDLHGRVVGVLQLSLPRWDNTHLGFVEVTVDPAVRRQGVGAQLFTAGVERTRAEGRTLVLAACWDRSAGVEFAKAMGLDRASEEVKRTQDLSAVDRTWLARLSAQAREHARDYDLLYLTGATPTGLLADIAVLAGAINDAPIDDLAVEDEVFTPDRIVAFDTAQRAHDKRIYRLVARHRDSGELAGHTLVAVDAQRPWRASQYDTSVVRPTVAIDSACY